MSVRTIEINMPEAFQFLFEPHRYKSTWGGRGSGKSWAFADALLILGLQKKLRILCTRELQSSIAESVHHLLETQITILGLTNDYEIQKSTIFSKNGTEFIFKGLKYNIDEIKSMEAVNICWIEEAQALSEASWEVLVPTIRKDGSEIWLSWNTGEVKDPTYKRFVLSPPDDCVSKLVSFRDNPYFPETLRKEMEYCKRVDYDAYMHIWEGDPLSISNACVFKGKYRIDDFETPADARFFHGADWGFSNDPTTLVRSFIKDNKLFVDYEAYGVGVELDEIPALFSVVPTYNTWPIKGDNSRPETISYLRKKHGLRVEAAAKWKGSVEDGISHLKKFEEIVVHSRCKHTAEEMKLYCYKTDLKTNEVLPIIVDKMNHIIDGIRYSLDGHIRGGTTNWIAAMS
jgi:phage terminase large subunit